jgi:hypothetical protein
MGLLFVVAREERKLYDRLVETFAGRSGVRVLLDRRIAQRRAAQRETPTERRQRERRVRLEAANQVATEGWTVVRVTRAGAG